MRGLVFAAIAAIIAASATAPAHARRGIAFVHGTGSQSDAEDEYWTPEMVDVVASGLFDPGLVVVPSCDLGQLAWHQDAAGCVAGEIADFVEVEGVDDLVIVTHSHGGNVVRWILSNPTYDERYLPVVDATSWVIALAPSSLGTPLADAALAGTTFETTVGWLLGYASDAVAMQQTASMAYYNAHWLLGTEGRPELPTGFWSVVGSDVESAFVDGDSWCGGYHLNVGLEVTQNWLDGCSDGFLACDSQAGAGAVWFTDVERTAGGEPLSHAQSRRPCFGLAEILRDDVEESP
jgi:hypothetical protein